MERYQWTSNGMKKLESDESTIKNGETDEYIKTSDHDITELEFGLDRVNGKQHQSYTLSQFISVVSSNVNIHNIVAERLREGYGR